MEIIYGRAGTGKSEYIFNDIKQSHASNNVYIITPEQFSFTAEKRLLDTLTEGATVKVEVLSFERMAYRVIKQMNEFDKPMLSKSGKSMIIFDAINKHQKELKFLGKSLENVDMIITQITEFKKHNISVEKLKSQVDNTKDEYLKAKLNDMYIMYKCLEDKICSDNKDYLFLDENDLLTILADNIENSHLFDNAIFYIDEFSGFTKQEYSVISKLNNIAAKIYVTVCSDDTKITSAPEADIFYDNKQTIQSLKKCVQDEDNYSIGSKIATNELADEGNSSINRDCTNNNKVSNENLDEIKLEKNYRFKNEELYHLEKNLFNIPYNIYQKDVKNIELYLAENQYAEIENVARKISNLVRNENYRYKDIAVISKNVDSYSSLCKAIFNEYDIPVFIDEKKDITQNIFIKYVLSILEIFSKNWSYESVFNYLKTGFVKVDNIYELENYCLKWGIKGNTWYKEKWNFEKDKNANNFNDDQQKIIEPLLEFKNKLLGRKDATQISSCLYEFLLNNVLNKIFINDNVNNKYDNRLEKNKTNIDLEKSDKVNQIKANDLGEQDKKNVALNIEEFEECWNLVIDLLNEITQIFRNQNMSFEDFTNILQTGLSTKELGQIPPTQDKVTIGDVNRSRTHAIKAVFIIGVNDGVFPSTLGSEGFLNDTDRNNLKQEGFELAKGTLEKMYEENFNIYKAFTSAEEKLFVSYSSADNDGGALRKSLYITRLKNIFPKLIEQIASENNEENIINENEKKIEQQNVDKNNSNEEKSELVDNIVENISTINVTFSNLINNLGNSRWIEVYKWYEKNEPKRLSKALEGLKFTNVPQILTKENTDSLYGKNLTTSISKLESYMSCPFSYYLKYDLKLSDKEKLDIKPIDTGSFMHEVIEKFFNLANNVKELNEDDMKKIIDKIVGEELSKYNKFTMTAKYRILVQRLKRVLYTSIKYIVESLKNSEFDVMGTEVAFGNQANKINDEENRKSDNFEISGNQTAIDNTNQNIKNEEKISYPPIKMKLDNGKQISIIGKIDRIDIAKMPDGKYIRIIDYKSSTKDIDLNKVIAGLQLQLITYVDAVCKNEENQVLPAGALYFTLIEPKLAKNPREMTEEKIEELIKQNYKMNGLILADVNVIKAMDTTLENGQSSNIVPATLNTSGEINYTKSSTVTKDEFENLQKTTTKIIKKISQEILSGNIELRPYYNAKGKNTPCQYCEYKSICQFNPKFKNNNYRYVANRKKQEILDEINKE